MDDDFNVDEYRLRIEKTRRSNQAECTAFIIQRTKDLVDSKKFIKEHLPRALVSAAFEIADRKERYDLLDQINALSLKSPTGSAKDQKSDLFMFYLAATVTAKNKGYSSDVRIKALEDMIKNGY